MRDADAFVVVVPHPDGAEVGKIVGPFPSLKEAAKWASTQPGGEKYIQTKLEEPTAWATS